MNNHIYDINELSASEGVREHLTEYLNTRDSDLTNPKSDTQKANEIFKFIVDNEITDFEQVLQWVFANDLWSAWRRGCNSGFRDLINKSRDKKIQNLLADNSSLRESILDYKKQIKQYNSFLKENNLVDSFNSFK